MIGTALIAALLALQPASPVTEPTPTDGDAILGLWATEPNERGYAHVLIERNGEEYRGRLVWLSQPNFEPGDPGGMAGQPRIDRENPDPALRERPALGLSMLYGLRYDGDGNWSGGSIGTARFSCAVFSASRYSVARHAGPASPRTTPALSHPRQRPNP